MGAGNRRGARRRGAEDPPPGEEHPDVGAPRRRQLAALPGAHRRVSRGRDREPGREVEEAVDKRVRFKAGDGAARMVASAGENVMPLEELVEHDAVDEAAQPETQDECGRPGRAFARRQDV
jgi:hypothetical protein